MSAYAHGVPVDSQQSQRNGQYHLADNDVCKQPQCHDLQGREISKQIPSELDGQCHLANNDICKQPQCHDLQGRKKTKELVTPAFMAGCIACLNQWTMEPSLLEHMNTVGSHSRRSTINCKVALNNSLVTLEDGLPVPYVCGTVGDKLG
eukprot:1154142-Pelagomonas_calceolata.AAC.3